MGTSAAAFVTAGIVVVGMLLRPWGTREWQWALGGAGAALLLRVESPAAAWSAIAGGANVYAFLAGIAVLAELARAEGVFAALAERARAASGGSRARLLALVYAAGAAVTALLSNDTTALVLTPAIFAVLDGAGVDPLPYLYACAFVANAASFVLPFSNPANLVTYGSRLPALGAWIGAFGPAALAAVAVTYGMLAWFFRARLVKPIAPAPPPGPLSLRARVASAALAVSAAGLIAAAAAGWSVGLAALLLAAGATVAVTAADRGAPADVVGHLPWQILPLVGGLFVVVDAVDRNGGLAFARVLMVHAAALPPIAGGMAAALASALASNAFNNLPVALAVSFANGSAPAGHVLHAAALGIDLGPNLSVTGSLSTLLWLVALRREGVDVSAGSFLRTGIVAGVPALLAAAVLVR
jgi:arsenical pump membrane protein